MEMHAGLSSPGLAAHYSVSAHNLVRVLRSLPHQGTVKDEDKNSYLTKVELDNLCRRLMADVDVMRGKVIIVFTHYEPR